jgi:hypothetical protein
MTHPERKYDEATKTAEAFMNDVNSMSFDVTSFADAVTTEHRTLQQNAFRAFAACIEQWAEMYETGRYDLRNEQTVKLAHEFWHNHLKDEGVPFV